MADPRRRRSRRRLLGGAGGALVAGVAGCVGSGSEARGGADDAGANTVAGTATTGRSGSDDGGEVASPTRVGSGTTGFDVGVDGDPVLGRGDAPVDLYYWTDYQCPFCKRFEEGAFPRLLDREVSEGRLRIVPLELPNIGQASWNAAVMARCVWKTVRERRPAAFLDWHRAVFEEQGEPNSGWASTGNLLSIAESVDGVDAAAVESRFEGDTAAELETVRTQRRRAGDAGVGATPGFVAYGRESGSTAKLTGAQPYERFSTVIGSVRS
jgi:protein-disulfide isomerase